MMRRTAMILWVALASSQALAQFNFHDDSEQGRLYVRDGSRNVLCYNYGMQLKSGVDKRYERGCYIHPLYDVRGRVISESFPPHDHPHHRGVGWTWPRVIIGDQQVQTWHPSDPPLRQHFVKWLKREADREQAVIAAEVAWMLETDPPRCVVKETVELVMHPLQEVRPTAPDQADAVVNAEEAASNISARPLDLTLTFEAVDEPVTLLGAKGKGYGGLMIRTTPDMVEGVITTQNEGRIKGDRTRSPAKWVDLSHDGRGVAIFTAPDHPPHPQGGKNQGRPPLPPRWLLRTSYAGLLNCAWPGVEPFTLRKGEPLTLRYRIYVHEGDAEQAGVKQAYQHYVEQMRQRSAGRASASEPTLADPG